jgi:cell division protein FtsW (lipid II flippase)
MAVRILWFLPTVLAVITDLVAAVFVRHHQPDYPIELVTFQIVMVAAALLVAAPQRSLCLVAFLLLLFGVFIAGMSVGMFYIPTLVAAGWIMAMRLSDQATPSFLDTKPQNGVTYTESELDAMKYRQSR